MTGRADGDMYASEGQGEGDESSDSSRSSLGFDPPKKARHARVINIVPEARVCLGSKTIKCRQTRSGAFNPQWATQETQQGLGRGWLKGSDSGGMSPFFAFRVEGRAFNTPSTLTSFLCPWCRTCHFPTLSQIC